MTYHVDGFLIGSNPGSKGGGYTIIDETGKRIERTTLKAPKFTGNDAELFALSAGLRIAAHGDVIMSDSQVCIGWILRGKANAWPELKPALEAAKLLAEDNNVRLWWSPRGKNLAGIYNERQRVPLD
jgi:ribonuclease HI